MQSKVIRSHLSDKPAGSLFSTVQSLTVVQSLSVDGNSEGSLDTGSESLGVSETDDSGVVAKQEDVTAIR